MFQNDLVAMKYIVLNVKHNFQHKKDVNFFFLYTLYPDVYFS